MELIEVDRTSSDHTRGSAAQRHEIRRVALWAMAAFSFAAIITIVMIMLSYFASDEVSEQLARAGNFASGGAAAWAFIVAMVALFISLKSETALRDEDRHHARLLQQQDVEAQYELQLAERAISVVLAIRRIRFALDQVLQQVEFELSQAANQEPIAPHGRRHTWFSMQSFVAAVDEASHHGVMDVLAETKTLYTNGSPSATVDTPLRMSLSEMILQLAADASSSIETEDTSLGMRWIRVERLIGTASSGDPLPQLPAAMLFATSTDSPIEESLGKAEFVLRSLQSTTVKDILQRWESAMERSAAA